MSENEREIKIFVIDCPILSYKSRVHVLYNVWPFLQNEQSSYFLIVPGKLGSKVHVALLDAMTPNTMLLSSASLFKHDQSETTSGCDSSQASWLLTGGQRELDQHARLTYTLSVMSHFSILNLGMSRTRKLVILFISVTVEGKDVGRRAK